MSKEERLERMNKEMVAIGKLLSNLLNRGVDGDAFQSAVELYDRTEADYNALKAKEE